MKNDKTNSRDIAAEAVGQRPASAIPAAVQEERRERPEDIVRQPAASKGPEASVADIAAEALGERVGDAYPDMTVAEAHHRSRYAGRGAAMRFETSWLGAQPLLAAATGFALGYVAALLVQRR